MSNEQEQDVLYAVRHAPSRLSGYCYGHADVELRINAAAAAARVLAQLPPHLELIYCSPSERTHSLALALSAHTGLSLCVDDRLRELNFGAWEGRTWDDIYQNDPATMTAWAEAPLEYAPPFGETGIALLTRVLSFLTEQPVARSLVVAHAGSIRAMRALATMPKSRLRPLDGVVLNFERAVEHLVIEPIVIHR